MTPQKIWPEGMPIFNGWPLAYALVTLVLGCKPRLEPDGYSLGGFVTLSAFSCGECSGQQVSGGR
jgi:hypothetical protein